MTNFNKLSEFTKLAERNRNYTSSTAGAFRVALKKFENLLNTDESSSVEVFASRIDSIFGAFVEKYKNDMSMSSMQEYRRRVEKVLQDYNTYGKDPTKISTWPAVKPQVRSPKRKSQSNLENHENPGSIQTQQQTSMDNSIDQIDSSYVKNEIPLLKNKKALLWVPYEISKKDVGRIKSFVTYLESISEDDLTN